MSILIKLIKWTFGSSPAAPAKRPFISNNCIIILVMLNIALGISEGGAIEPVA